MTSSNEISVLQPLSEPVVQSFSISQVQIRDSLMVRIRACRARDRGSIPRRGEFF